MYTEGLLSFEDQRRERVRDAFGRDDLPASLVRDVLSAFDAYFEEGWQLDPDAHCVLEKLRDLPLGIVTNGSAKQQHAKVDRLGLRDRFQCIVISDDVGFAKPDPRIFLLACHELGCKAAECTFLGDSWASDVLGSASVGMQAVWRNRYGRDRQMDEIRVQVIDRLAGLPDLVRGV